MSQTPSDPINTSGQSWPASPYSQSEQPSAPPPPNSTNLSGQDWPVPSYPQTGQPVVPLSGSPNSTGQSWPASSYPQTGQPTMLPLQPYPPQTGHPGEEHFYNQDPKAGGPNTRNFGAGSMGKLHDQPPNQPPKRNGWKVATTVLLVLVLIFAATAVVALTHLNRSSTSGAIAVATPTSIAGQSTTIPGATQPPATSVSSATPTATTLSSNNYSAIQPGPGCDKNGGTWTPQGFSGITCGTALSPSSSNTRGYLFLQLPNNHAFSSNNKIGVIGNPVSSTCVGLDEQDANTGFLVEYCGDGHWFIYTISSDGTIVQTLDKNLTSTRTTVDISLTLKSTTLSFSIDNEVHDVNSISPIQPTKVAITYFPNNSGNSITINNFSYTVLSS